MSADNPTKYIHNNRTFFTAYNFVGAAGAVIECEGDISPVLIWGANRCAAVLLSYGLIVFIVSRFIDMVQKPRI